MKRQIAIDCKVCNNVKTMFPDSVPKRLEFFYNLGWIMIIPAIVMLTAYTICFIFITNNYHGHPFYRYAQCFTGVFVIASIALLVKGLFFVAGNRAFKCRKCGTLLVRNELTNSQVD